MWNIQLTKADKRRCRELIHIGLERECEQFAKEMRELASMPIPLTELNEPYREENGFSVEGPWHKRYIALYKKTEEYDKPVDCFLYIFAHYRWFFKKMMYICS